LFLNKDDTDDTDSLAFDSKLFHESIIPLRTLNLMSLMKLTVCSRLDPSGIHGIFSKNPATLARLDPTGITSNVFVLLSMKSLSAARFDPLGNSILLNIFLLSLLLDDDDDDDDDGDDNAFVDIDDDDVIDDLLILLKILLISL